MRGASSFFALVPALSGALLTLALGCGSTPTCDPGACTGDAGATGGSGGATSTGGAGGSGGGTFLCKGGNCLVGKEECSVTNTIQGDTGECLPLPALCEMPGADCTCFGDLAGCTCQVLAAGAFATFCNATM
jgi:hypothetical protein